MNGLAQMLNHYRLVEFLYLLIRYGGLGSVT